MAITYCKRIQILGRSLFMFKKYYIVLLFSFISVQNSPVLAQNTSPHIFLKQKGSLPITHIAIVANIGTTSLDKTPGTLFLTKLLIAQSPLSKQIDALGGSLSVFINRDFISFETTVLNTLSFKAISTIISFFSAFHPDLKAIKTAKSQLDSYIKQSNADPESRLSKITLKTIYGSHPYATSVMGSHGSIQKITRASIQKALKTIFSQPHLYFIVAGDTKKISTSQLKTLYNALPQGSDTKPLNLAIQNYKSKSVTIQDKKLSQSFIQVSMASKSLTVDETPYLMLIEQIIGRGFSSRLFLELRQKRGLTYSPRASYSILKYSTLFNIVLSTKLSSKKESLTQIDNILKNVREKGFSSEELVVAKKIILNRIYKKQEKLESATSNIIQHLIYNFPIKADILIPSKLKKISLEDLNKFTKHYLTTNKPFHITLG